MTNNRVSCGPKWAQIPFYYLSHVFWPDRKLLRSEAEAVKEYPEHRMTLAVRNTDNRGTVLLKWQCANQHTPILNQHLGNFLNHYGDFGKVLAHYFYIEGGSDYEWHVDNVIPTAVEDWGRNLPVNCCLNVIVTDDDSECEFYGHGTYKYTAGVLNTSHPHRVQPATQRILTRISFYDVVYEEVVHRIRKIDKINAK